MLATPSDLYDKLLNVYTTQYDKATKDQKKKIKVQNRPEKLVINLYLDVDEDDLPLIPWWRKKIKSLKNKK